MFKLNSLLSQLSLKIKPEMMKQQSLYFLAAKCRKAMGSESTCPCPSLARYLSPFSGDRAPRDTCHTCPWYLLRYKNSDIIYCVQSPRKHPVLYKFAPCIDWLTPIYPDIICCDWIPSLKYSHYLVPVCIPPSSGLCICPPHTLYLQLSMDDALYTYIIYFIYFISFFLFIIERFPLAWDLCLYL